jgi:hypothetical protein
MSDVRNTVPLGPGAHPSTLQEGHENNNHNKIQSPYQLREVEAVGFFFVFQNQASFTKFYDAFEFHIKIMCVCVYIYIYIYIYIHRDRGCEELQIR